MMRWYVEPLAYDQRSFNAAALAPGRRPRAARRRARGRAGAAPRGGSSARAQMRIAVLRPQVPFASGGAEIFTDELVAELRARGHEADLVSVPFKWYPGARVLTQAFLWRMLDLEEADGRPIDLVVATKFPSYVVRHPREARLARAPVPPGVRARRHRARAVRPVAGGAGAPPAGAGARPRRARRGDAPLRHVGERRRAPRAVDRPRRRGRSRTPRRRSRTAPRPRTASSSPRAGSTAPSGSTCCSRRRRSSRASTS